MVWSPLRREMESTGITHNRTMVRNIIQSTTTERDLRAPLVQLSIVQMKKLRLREGKALAWIQENYRKAETRT